MFPGSRFLPTFCRYNHDIGDLHGGHYFKSLQQLLIPIEVCTQVRENSSDHYFSRRKRDTAKLPKQRRHERRHIIWECTFANSSATGGDSSNKDTDPVLPYRVFIERIDIISFADINLPDNCSRTRGNAATNCTNRKLFQKLFDDYFARDNRYPDVILYFSNSDDKGFGKTLNKTRSEIASFRDVINRCVPQSTSFYWFNHLSENDLKKKADWKDVLYEGKYTANEMILRTNRAMYDVVRDDTNTNRIHTFFDLHAMTLPLAEWSRDGIHLKHDWYVYLMSYWLQTACSKFM